MSDDEQEDYEEEAEDDEEDYYYEGVEVIPGAGQAEVDDETADFDARVERLAAWGELPLVAIRKTRGAATF